MDLIQPARKILTPRLRKPSPGSHITRYIERAKKCTLITKSNDARELTADQKKRAMEFSRMEPPRQRSDTELMERTLKKRSRSTVLANDPSTSQFHQVLQQAYVARPFPLGPKLKPKPTVDWEAQGLAGIKARKLSFDTVWSAGTWKAKSHQYSRLMLLKNDGYDVTPLLAKGVTADHVIGILLTRIEEYKKRSVTTTAISEDSEPEQEGEPSSFVAINKLLQTNQEIDGRDNKMHGIEKYNDSSTSVFEKFKASVSAKVPVPTPFRPGPQKRRLSHKDDDNECDDGSKAAKILYHVKPTWNHMKRPAKRIRLCGPDSSAIEFRNAAQLRLERISRDIFRATRIARTISSSKTKYQPSPPVPVSTVLFLSRKETSLADLELDLQIGFRSLHYLQDEIKYLAGGCSILEDPNASDDHRGDRLMEYPAPSLCHPTAAGEPQEEPYRHWIQVERDHEGRMIMVGDARALIGLLDRLKKEILLHTSNWAFNGLELVRMHKYVHRLGGAGRRALDGIQAVLTRGVNIGGVEVVVGQIWEAGLGLE